ncbi:MAG: phosphate ABC transporter permease subunit PstC [Anaerolineae bacterium]|jgi:phosphate transport system permease protein
MHVRYVIDRIAARVLLISAFVALLVLLLIALFTAQEAWPAFTGIGLDRLLTTTEWRPQRDLFGILPMILGSFWVTAMAVVLALPVGLGCAVYLVEVAPRRIAGLVKPSIELLAGIPSVVYGIFGLLVLVPLVRQIPVTRNTGFGILAAGIVLGVMILPTLISVSADALRAVPRTYKEGSLALGMTHWQTIWGVLVPAARSGIAAAVILGIGRAIGETMAMILVIGNSPIIPKPLTNNPFTILLSQARTLTGNIAVEISYAYGMQEHALFATGVVLFVAIIVVNSAARVLLRGATAGVSR